MNTANLFANQAKTLGYLFAFFTLVCGVLRGQEHEAASVERKTDVVKVFLLAGQSNMQGHGIVDLDDAKKYNGGKGNLKSLLADKKKQNLLAHTHDGNGNWITRNDVFVRHQTKHGLKAGGLSVGFTSHADRSRIGPEFQFGHILGERFEEPVLLIKTAWGGKSLFEDFRPPSAGGETGPYFKQMIEEYRAGIASVATDFPELADKNVELAGFVWMQGWNDMCSAVGRAEYEQNLVHLINDVRNELNAPNLPVVVGELGNGSDSNKNLIPFRKSQAQACYRYPFIGNVGFVSTTKFKRPSQKSPNVKHHHHWCGNAESYFLIGDALGKKMARLLGWQQKRRVLIIGDSISMGYGKTVSRELGDVAWVVRPTDPLGRPENCAGTTRGIERIDEWLTIGGGDWDLIHFNFGLHDLKHMDAQGKNSNSPDDPPQADLVAYEKNLRAIVAKLKATEAKLIFATTTPFPAGVKPFRDPASAAKYNGVAEQIMVENEIEVNDLFAFAGQRLEEIQIPVNVHFKPAGSVALGKAVARKIRVALEAPE